VPAPSSVIQVLAAAIAAEPDDLSLRLHLAPLLLGAGDAAACLEQVAAILARDPANVDALGFGAEAAQACGDENRAAGYRRLLQALHPPVAEVPARAPQTEVAADPYDLSTLGRPDTAPLEPSRTPSDLGSSVLLPVRAEAEGDDEEEPCVEIERPELRLKDVAGMEAVKRRLELAFLAPMQNPELSRAYRKSLRGGLMLYGPPGCGKTYIARAVAGELGAKFIPVGLSDVLDMWFGESERKLEGIFDIARRNSPCVLFFDEVDGMAQKRSQLRGAAGRSLVNQLLAQMDSVGASNEGVFILAATNVPWDVDPALRRPGRFDRVTLVLPPDEPAREAALRHHMRDRPAEGIDYRWLVQRTDWFSGADLAHLCESAAELALGDSLRTASARPIGMLDFRRALKEVRPTTRAWFESARNFAMFANQDGAYDDLLAYMRARRI
jgi:AAA+ superfamily predicted ATPase